MTTRLLTILLIVAAVGSGLMGGLFFVFSNVIMSSFDRLPGGGGVPAMQRINEVILNPLFFLVFFGTAVLCLVFLVFLPDSPAQARCMGRLHRCLDLFARLHCRNNGLQRSSQQ